MADENDVDSSYDDRELIWWLEGGVVRELTISFRVSGRDTGEHLALANGDDDAIVLVASDANELRTELRVASNADRLVLSAPWAAIGRAAHDVVVRLCDQSFELYVDGVPMDGIRTCESLDFGARLTVRALPGAARLSVWKRAISMDEIAANAGGREEVATRRKAYLGDEARSVPYWKPTGFRVGIGGCMPLHDGERFRLLYILDRSGRRIEMGQVSSANGLEWERHPPPFAVAQGELGAGSLLRHNGCYYVFYSWFASDGSPSQVTWAVSRDGVRYEASGMNIDIPPSYLPSSVRDPHVFRAGDGAFHLLATARLSGVRTRNGCLLHLVSVDLAGWKEVGPPFVPGFLDAPACPAYFEWNGWHYLMFGGDGVTRYRYSDRPFGPWRRPAHDAIDGLQFRAPKTSSLPGDRRIAAGYLAPRGGEAGRLVFRELVQRPDGTLAHRFVPEFLRAEAPEPVAAIEALELTGGDGYASSGVYDAGGECRLSFEASVSSPLPDFGFEISGSAESDVFSEVRFEPARRKLGVRSSDATLLQERATASIDEVDGLDREVRVEAILRSGWIDIEVNGNRTLISRIDRADVPHIRFFVRSGSVAFRSIRFVPIAPDRH